VLFCCQDVIVRCASSCAHLVLYELVRSQLREVCFFFFFFFFMDSFIHSIGMCKIRQFRAVLRSFFHPSLLCTFFCHPSPPTILPPSLTSFCHLFLGLLLNLLVPKFIYNTLLGILFPSILCTCPNQCNLSNLIVCIIVRFFMDW